MKIEFSSIAAKDYKKQNIQIKQRVKKAIQELCNHSVTLDIKKLKTEKNKFRIRIGDFRIIFSYDKKEERAIIEKIRHRKDAYK